jgi:hypothetical protein
MLKILLANYNFDPPRLFHFDLDSFAFDFLHISPTKFVWIKTPSNLNTHFMWVLMHTDF